MKGNWGVEPLVLVDVSWETAPNLQTTQLDGHGSLDLSSIIPSPDV